MFRCCAVVVSLLLALFGAELVFRIAVPVTSAYSVAATGNQYHFYKYDPVLGWANAPGAKGSFQREEFDYHVAINSHGMRQSEVAFEPAPGTRRIAVLGDSFVWGIGVADEDRLTEQLAGQLCDVEVLNFGVSGYAPIQYLLDLDRVLSFAPELVIVVFCLGNDFVDNVQSMRYGYYKPYAELGAQGQLQIRGRSFPNTKQFGFATRATVLGSQLLGTVGQWLGAEPLGAQVSGLTGLVEADMYQFGEDQVRVQEQASAVAINEALLAAIAARVRGVSARLVVVPAPTKFEYDSEGGARHPRYSDALEQKLVASCRRLAIDVVPTVQQLNAQDFWVRDGHWNAGGHQKIAATVAAHLVSQGFRKAN